ncbi:MAG: tetratricopeptide repeat protein [Gammaproteobacteria bacterium]|nr:tetratricopeptide repeat protein [Gammaproteobacteria bacterium]NND60395.1 tetratricopeptide repeat protein [Gammaproteobacteria bacterium]
MKSKPVIQFAILAILLAGNAVAQQTGLCGNAFVNPFGWGPFDYLNPIDHATKENIPTLEKHHFNINVQMGRSQGQTGSILGDLRFILRACPNHHPALNVLIKYHVRNQPLVPPTESVSCYLERASQFNPEDGMVYMLKGIYLARTGKNEQALTAYQRGLELVPDAADLHYNVGLLYAELGRLEKANEHAVRAYTLGAQLPGLKRKLIRLDAWNPDIATSAEVTATDHEEESQ